MSSKTKNKIDSQKKWRRPDNYYCNYEKDRRNDGVNRDAQEKINQALSGKFDHLKKPFKNYFCQF